MAHAAQNGQRLGRPLSVSFEAADPKALLLAVQGAADVQSDAPGGT